MSCDRGIVEKYFNLKTFDLETKFRTLPDHIWCIAKFLFYYYIRDETYTNVLIFGKCLRDI